jgi:hypothetical protein
MRSAALAAPQHAAPGGAMQPRQRSVPAHAAAPRAQGRPAAEQVTFETALPPRGDVSVGIIGGGLAGAHARAALAAAAARQLNAFRRVGTQAPAPRRR